MNKKILLLIISLILIPTFVFAKDTCNDNNIKIKSITLKELNGFSEEVQESSVNNNNTINLNLKMYDVGDSSTYYITVENTSSEDYYFTKDSMKLENDYLEYSLRNDSEVISAKNEKTIELKVSYKNKIPNEKYSDTSKLIISLSDKPLENPETKMTYTFILILISLIAITIYTKINNKSLSKKKLLLAISFLSVIPISTTALCTVNLNVETKIEIENKEAIFLPGKEVNIKMKELAGDDTSTSTNGYSFKDENIQAIKYSSQEPNDSNKENKNIVSTSDSPYSIYMWYENNTIYWWSEDIHPSLNEDATYMFDYLAKLTDISGLETIDSSDTKIMYGTFINCNLLDDISVLSHWDVSNVQDMWVMFYGCYSMTSLDALANWDTSNVTEMRQMFQYDRSLQSLKPLKNWDVSKVNNMLEMFFYNSSLTSLEGLENWDTSKVVNISLMFAYCTSLENISALENWNLESNLYLSAVFMSDTSLTSIEALRNWNTSNVTYTGTMFAGCNKITDLTPLKDWDMSKVTDMNQMFIDCTGLESLSGLEIWNTSKVFNMQFMFSGCNKLTDIQALKNWNISNVTNMDYLFNANSVLKDLTPLKNWNTSSVTTMGSMFKGCKSIKTLAGLENWDVSNVINFSEGNDTANRHAEGTFQGLTGLIDATAINDWNIRKDAFFNNMFKSTPTHPEFTKVPGTWDSSGTFTPTP